jgi:hypothetical protein
VNDSDWRWADAERRAVDRTGRAPEPHQIQVELVIANHQAIDQAAVFAK